MAALVCIIIAIVCWGLAALNVPVPRLNLTALGLFFFGLSLVIGRV